MNTSPAVDLDPQTACMICALDGVRCLPADEAFRIKGFAILRCQRCGLLWTRIGPTFDPDSLYTQEYFQGGVSDGYFDYLGSELFLSKEYRARLSLIRAHLPVGRLLEIGCATGAFLQEAQRYYSVHGIDVSRFAVEAARRKGLDVSCGHLQTTGTLRSPYDAIVMFDTIEHLKDPLSTLRNARELLRPGGFIFISTGDVESLTARLLRAKWRLLTPPQHLWFFSASNLPHLLDRLGFRVLSLHHPWRLVPLTLIWYQLFRGRARPLPSLLGRIALPMNLYDVMMIVATTQDDFRG